MKLADVPPASSPWPRSGPTAEHGEAPDGPCGDSAGSLRARRAPSRNCPHRGRSPGLKCNGSSRRPSMLGWRRIGRHADRATQRRGGVTGQAPRQARDRPVRGSRPLAGSVNRCHCCSVAVVEDDPEHGARSRSRAHAVAQPDAVVAVLAPRASAHAAARRALVIFPTRELPKTASRRRPRRRRDAGASTRACAQAPISSRRSHSEQRP